MRDGSNIKESLVATPPAYDVLGLEANSPEYQQTVDKIARVVNFFHQNPIRTEQDLWERDFFGPDREYVCVSTYKDPKDPFFDGLVGGEREIAISVRTDGRETAGRKDPEHTPYENIVVIRYNFGDPMSPLDKTHETTMAERAELRAKAEVGALQVGDFKVRGVTLIDHNNLSHFSFPDGAAGIDGDEEQKFFDDLSRYRFLHLVTHTGDYRVADYQFYEPYREGHLTSSPMDQVSRAELKNRLDYITNRLPSPTK